MATIILLQPKQRLIEKVRCYVDAPESFTENRERAISDLLQVLPAADPELRHKIMMVLARFAKEQAAEPLCKILKDPLQSPRTRHYAAVQLCVVLPFLDDPVLFVDDLIEAAQSPDPKLRRYAVTALGWRDNSKSFEILAARLYDEDLGVRLAAVNALCSCGDKRVMALMVEKLESAPVDEKRAVLFNLWRLDSSSARLTRIYLNHLNHENPELRLASLALLSFSGKRGDGPEMLCQCLKDPDHRVRKLALDRLADMGPTAIVDASSHIRALLDDDRMDIKRAALATLKGVRDH